MHSSLAPRPQCSRAHMACVSLSVIVFALLSCTSSQTITQKPPSLVGRRGDPASLHCSVIGTSNPNLYWYRQTLGATLQLLAYSISTGSVAENTLEHFTARRPEDLTFTLETERLMLNDSAVYFCAWSRETINSEQYFGKGTRLTVLEDGLETTAPKVALFDPSPREVKERHSATLVCLATNFYPDHVVLSWSVNGVERTEGVKTDDQPTQGSDKMYSLSSRLRILKKEWMNPQTTFSCRVYFDPMKINITMETKGRAASYGRSANTAKFIYLLLIAKTASYGLFVTLCVMKMKPSNEKIFS